MNRFEYMHADELRRIWLNGLNGGLDQVAPSLLDVINSESAYKEIQRRAKLAESLKSQAQ